jgi:2-polyprenyl-6-methoxyphenol hydroxylase-like FAD-dependent oxidoreductase
MNKPIIILGGGIGGLAMASSLRHFNIPFQLYEAAPTLGEVGAGIGISESTVKILEILGLENDLKSKGRYVRDAIIVDKQGNIVRKLPITDGGFCVHRMDLINILKKNIPTEHIFLNHKLHSFEQKSSEITLHFENSTSLQTDCLIVADGINSLVRKQIYSNIEKRYSGQTIWRGIADIELGEKYQNAYLEFWGDNLRFATIPLAHNQYYWYAVQVAPEGQTDEPNTLKMYLQNLFRNHTAEISSVIGNTPKIIRNDMYDLQPHQQKWHHGPLIFIGDAIHATTPNLAQGGCQAIEDAFYLSLLIQKFGFTTETFIKFQQQRQEKVNYIVEQSWRFGKTAHTSHRFLDWAVQTLFRFLPDSFFTQQYQKLIDIDYIRKEL